MDATETKADECGSAEPLHGVALMGHEIALMKAAEQAAVDPYDVPTPALDRLLASVKHHLKMECVNEGGPTLDRSMEFTLDVQDDPVLQRVLEVKGELHVWIKALPVATQNEAFMEQQKRIRESLGQELPVNMVGSIG